MSDNKTPINLVIQAIEERISIYYSERQECVNDDDQKGINSCDSLINELNRTLQILKSHLALEEQRDKNLQDKAFQDGIECQKFNQMMKQFKPE